MARDLPARGGLHGPGAQARQITAGVGLAEALTPDLVAPQQRSEQAGLLRLGAEGEQGRRHPGQGQEVREKGRPGPGQLLLDHGLLPGVDAAPAVLFGHVEAEEARVVHLRLPVLVVGELVLRLHLEEGLGQFEGGRRGPVVRDEGAYLRTKSPVLVRLAHLASAHARTAGARDEVKTSQGGARMRRPPASACASDRETRT